MGLDMYLTGEKFLTRQGTTTEDGYPVKERHLALGYWRKHPDLHGFIVQEFADGEDKCQRIDLDQEALRKILDAVKADALLHTKGFFFGSSGKPNSEDKEERKWYQERKADTTEILAKALDWLQTEEKNVWRSVCYRASW